MDGAPRFCPACGRPRGDPDRFCRGCGFRFIATTGGAPPAPLPPPEAPTRPKMPLDRTIPDTLQAGLGILLILSALLVLGTWLGWIGMSGLNFGCCGALGIAFVLIVAFGLRASLSNEWMRRP